MSDLVGLFNLVVPFFGLIALGFFCGKVVRRPEGGLAWMQFYLIYVALPCLFFKLIADKPLDELSNWGFVAATTLSTFLAFASALAIGYRYTRALPQAVMQGVAGAYSNIGYMGPPLILAALGPAASPAVVLIFVFDSLLRRLRRAGCGTARSPVKAASRRRPAPRSPRCPTSSGSSTSSCPSSA